MIPYESFRKNYRSGVNRRVLILLAILAMAIVASFLRIAFDQYNIDFFEAYSVLIDHLMGVPVANETDEYVIWERTTPRAIAVFVVGAGLGVCGAAMQSTLKNPLADPYMTGISSGANFGISLAIVYGISVIPFLSGQAGMIVNAFALSLVPALFIVGVSIVKSISPAMMILVGVSVMYVFSAATTMLNLMASPTQYVQIYTWALGTLGSIQWQHLPFVIAASAIGIVSLSLLNARLNLLSYTDKESVSLGLNPRRTRIIMIIIVSLVTAILVCFSGTIGFVGLVAPHVMRILIGSDNRYLIPASAFGGALMLAVADTIAVKILPSGLPVGVITSLIGGPLFIYILIRQHKKIWS